MNKLNEILEKNKYDYRYSLSELLFHIDEFPKEDRENILFNLGGVLNHNLYWNSLSPKKVTPKGRLKISIDKKYNSFEKFVDEFKKKALSLKGSGYTFLVLNNLGELDIINLTNQVTPLSYGSIPLFTVDMWEHAYYLNYKNEKSNYLDNIFNIADFSMANAIFNEYYK